MARPCIFNIHLAEVGVVVATYMSCDIINIDFDFQSLILLVSTIFLSSEVQTLCLLHLL